MKPTLVIRWHEGTQQWQVLDIDSHEVVEKFAHLLDAGWFVQSEDRRVS